MGAKVKLRLYATVVSDQKTGKTRLAFKNEDYYRQQVDQFKFDKYVVVTIENKRSQRSPQQNNYWWGVCYPIISEATGFTVNEVHEWAKQTFMKPKIIRIGKVEAAITASSTQLSIGEGVDYTDAIRDFAEHKLDAYIPTPCEAGYFCGRDDCPVCMKEMDSAKTGDKKGTKTS